MSPPPEASAEPSIEEILDSIRQIIADDDEGGGGEAAAAAPAAPTPPPAKPPAAPAADEIIELTERAPEPAKAAPPPPPPPPPTPPPVREPIEVDMTDSEPEAEPPPPPPPVRTKAPEPPMTLEPMDDLESVITQKAEAAAVKAFSELTQRASIEKGGGVTIEDVVRYEVRPLLRAWIDKYLPGIVERLLQKELEKISRRFDQE